MATITPAGVGARYVAALMMVALTWNPSGFSYYHWAGTAWAEGASLVVFVGLLLLVGWVVFVNTALRSLGMLGLVLSAAVCGSLVWLLVDFGWLDLANATAMSWVALAMVALILGIGMSWSLLQRKFSGQIDVDDIDDKT
jgi:hypothetical protein